MSNVHHPEHYNTGKIEVIDAIEDWRLDFNAGNAVKYIARAGKKDRDKEIEDLQKAQWYLARKIVSLKKPQVDGPAPEPVSTSSSWPNLRLGGRYRLRCGDTVAIHRLDLDEKYPYVGWHEGTEEGWQIDGKFDQNQVGCTLDIVEEVPA